MQFHGGTLTVRSGPEGNDRSRDASGRAGGRRIVTGGRVAIVEDDRALLDQIRWALKSSWDVSAAEDAVAGLALLADQPDLFPDRSSPSALP